MSGDEKIQNEELFRIMEQLRQNKTKLSMRLVGQNYHKLTVVTKILQEKHTPFFIIESPSDFKSTITKLGTWEIQFNFRGQDNLEYIFDTFGGDFLDEQPRIPFPKYIERLQRRRHFRLSVPAGTKLYFDLGKIRQEIDLMNISMSGSLGILKTSIGRDPKKPILQKEEHIRNLEIVFPFDIRNSEQKLNVNKAIIRRAEYDPKRKADIYAFEFDSIDKDQKKILTEVIFNLQRSILKKK